MYREQPRTGLHVAVTNWPWVGAPIVAGDIVLVTDFSGSMLKNEILYELVTSSGQCTRVIAFASPRELIPLEEYRSNRAIPV